MSEYRTPQQAAGYIVSIENKAEKERKTERMVLQLKYLPDGNQMKAADMFTIEQIGIPSLVLMERAALGIVREIYRSGTDASAPLIVCGSGNNGGDGFAVARLLAERGEAPKILFAGREESLSGECAVQKKIVENMGIPVFTDCPCGEYTVIIDAVFGVGLCREISGKYGQIIQWMNQQKCRKIAVDIPSGICSRTGRILGTAFRADLTVSMACEKIGLRLSPGREYAGEVTAVPIGISTALFENNPEVAYTCGKEDLPDLLPKRGENTNKGDFGKVLMITGSRGMAGASVLAAAAAYSVGAGLVRVYTADENRPVLQQTLPEAIITGYHEYNEKELDLALDWADVVCIGCGLGQSRLSEQIFLRTMERLRVPCVIDADGLNLLSGHMELLKQRKAPLILTPHLKEMSRLTGKTISEITSDRRAAAEEFAAEYPAICVMKDSRTFVAEHGQRTFLNLAGNSAMAKAGSGDVLAGMITGLAAQMEDLNKSAVLGVLLHACGGDEAREQKGSRGVLARDLIAGTVRCMRRAEEKIENETA